MIITVSSFELALAEESIWRVQIAMLLFLSIEMGLKNQKFSAIASSSMLSLLIARSYLAHAPSDTNRIVDELCMLLLFSLLIIHSYFARGQLISRHQVLRSTQSELNGVR